MTAMQYHQVNAASILNVKTFVLFYERWDWQVLNRQGEWPYTGASMEDMI